MTCAAQGPDGVMAHAREDSASSSLDAAPSPPRRLSSCLEAILPLLPLVVRHLVNRAIRSAYKEYSSFRPAPPAALVHTVLVLLLIPAVLIHGTLPPPLRQCHFRFARSLVTG